MVVVVVVVYGGGGDGGGGDGCVAAAHTAVANWGGGRASCALFLLTASRHANQLRKTTNKQGET